MIVYAEGTPATGAGHLVRSAALADALGARLATRDVEGSLHGWAWAGRPVLVIDAPTPDAAVHRLRAEDALVVDHPRVTDVADCVVVEDVPGRALAGARLVVNPWAVPADYPSLPTATGPAHVLLRPEFAPGAHSRDDTVLLGLGATDHLDAIDGVAAAVRASGRQVLIVGRPPLSATDLAAAMRRCGTGILSCSGLICEADACGLPVVAVRTAADQQRLAALLTAAGVPVFAPQDATEIAAATAVRPGLFGPGGAQRVADRIREVRIASPLRPARWSDAELLLTWANDPGTRAASFRPAAIDGASHHRWLRGILQDPERRLLLSDAGTVRLAREGSDATVSIAVAPERRGRGEGGRLLAALAGWAAEARFCRRLVAWVRDDNPASHRLFAGAGYLPAGTAVIEGCPSARLHLELP